MISKYMYIYMYQYCKDDLSKIKESLSHSLNWMESILSLVIMLL